MHFIRGFKQFFPPLGFPPQSYIGHLLNKIMTPIFMVTQNTLRMCEDLF